MSTAAIETDEVVVNLNLDDLAALDSCTTASKRQSRSIGQVANGRAILLLILFPFLLKLLAPQSKFMDILDGIILQLRWFVFWAFCLAFGLLVGLGITTVVLYRLGRLSFDVMKRLLEDPRTSWRYGPLHCSISPEGLTIRAAFATYHEGWPAVSKISVTEKHVFFFITEALVHMIPCRAFHDADAFAAFVERAQQFHQSASLAQASLPAQNTPTGPSNAITDNPT